jgi:antitoxin (DNA-binding transcriptional repressor) of toxin-antitoxin stability system
VPELSTGVSSLIYLIEVRRQRTPLTARRAGWPVYYGRVSEPGFAIRAEDQPGWAEIVRRAERGESVAVIAHGDHVADVVPSGELDRLRETIEVLSDTELVRDLQEGLADARAGRVFPAGQVAADLAARRVAGE